MRCSFVLLTIIITLLISSVRGDEPAALAVEEMTESPPEQVIVTPATLEFAVLVNPRDHPDLLRGADKQLYDAESEDRLDIMPVEEGGERARWVLVAKDASGKDRVADLLGCIFRVRPTAKGDRLEALVILPPEASWLTGALLVECNPSFDPEKGPSLNFEFDAHGAKLLTEVTRRYAPSRGDKHRTHLGILLKGELHSAPVIELEIPYGRGQISGSFTQSEIKDLAALLSAEASLNPDHAIPAEPTGIFAWVADGRMQVIVVAILGLLVITAIAWFMLRRNPKPAVDQEPL